MSEALKPCPFCGANGYQATHRITDTRGAFLCHACNARGPEDVYDPFKLGAGVIAARWNRRAVSPAVLALVKSLSTFIDEWEGVVPTQLQGVIVDLAAVEKEIQ